MSEMKITTKIIPDYFIIDGVRIGKQDPNYNECVIKYCKQSKHINFDVDVKEEVKNESKEG